MTGQFNNQARPKQPEGTTTILKEPHSEQQIKKNVGEYIDYEEID